MDSRFPAFAHDPIDTLYVEHHGWLKKWLAFRLRGRGHELAEDLAHDTFVRVLRRHGACAPLLPREPRAYLTTVAKGVLVSWLRRQTLEQEWLLVLAEQPPSHWPSAEQQAMLMDTVLALDGALAQLRPCVRQAFLMATFDGLRYQDIAQQLGLAVPTVKGYVQAGLLACLQQMADA